MTTYCPLALVRKSGKQYLLLAADQVAYQVPQMFSWVPYSPRLLTPHLMASKSPMNNHPLYQVHSPNSTTPLVRRPMVLVREEPLFVMFTRAIL
ncbi:hypothetical protein HZ326_5095 [Fusarium oxysporum f. sp. albedinis]|nr:hypothetical protein HZ326_5095 [Fusarium oxysporum f. sp. albedinis]